MVIIHKTLFDFKCEKCRVDMKVKGNGEGWKWKCVLLYQVLKPQVQVQLQVLRYKDWTALQVTGSGIAYTWNVNLLVDDQYSILFQRLVVYSITLHTNKKENKICCQQAQSSPKYKYEYKYKYLGFKYEYNSSSVSLEDFQWEVPWRQTVSFTYWLRRGQRLWLVSHRRQCICRRRLRPLSL